MESIISREEDIVSPNSHQYIGFPLIDNYNIPIIHNKKASVRKSKKTTLTEEAASNSINHLVTGFNFNKEIKNP